MSKAKGSRTERELFHKLWAEGWATIRAAGSGSTTRPCPDLLASNGTRTLAIECKALKDSKKYFESREIEELISFSSGFGAEAWIGIRFDSKDWFFVLASDVPQSKGKRLVLTMDFVQKEGKKFEELLGKFEQGRLF